MQLAAIPSADRQADSGKHISGIQPFSHLHDRHTGLGFSGHDGLLNRRSAAQLRQERSVNIDTAKLRQVQDFLRQDLSISGHHADVRLPVRKRL